MFITSLARRVVGSRNERLLRRLGKVVNTINKLEEKISKLSSAELLAQTTLLKQRLAEGAKLDDLLPEAFAVVREAAKRTLNMRHFDVQLIGGMVLHYGKIAEMRTGEGKTLVATLPVYLNALTGHGVHIITVNDYLAKRDSEWMKPVYQALGLKVGVVVHGMSREEKQAAYASDVVYGTNNEFGFDYLRDNMAFSAEERMQSKLKFAIVDEVDSILIDEARTPLIISGADQDSSELYIKIDKLIPKLEKQTEKDGPGDYSLDEKSRQAFLTEAGHKKIEDLLVTAEFLAPGASLYDANNINLMHHVYAALRAHSLFKRDVDYIVRDGEVIIVDEHTGRTMQGRRWSDGLHQAMEAKERVDIQSESQTLASITFQNYFRLYNKLAGMTGTADTEAYEFQQIYGLEVVVIPPNKPNCRKDFPDLIYLTKKEKFAAIIADIEDCFARKQPVLVGTVSIETSEFLSGLLTKSKLPHQVLNAKFHEKEAQIISEAGRPGAITIATNMAGRGTDIVLGGNLEAELAGICDHSTCHCERSEAIQEKGLDCVVAKTPCNDEEIENRKEQWKLRHSQVISNGGLHIIGTERHESRRIDNQLRGRSGRQGDPGSTRFYLSVEDNLMRIFISDRVSGLLSKLGMQNGEAITHPWVNKAIENAQRKVEGHNFDIRKQLLEFDDVANDQRRVVYQQRNELMETNNISNLILEIRADVIQEVIAEFIPPQSIEEQWDIPGLMQTLGQEFGQKLDIKGWLAVDNNLHEESLNARIVTHFIELFKEKEARIGAENMRYLEKTVMLNVLDSHWKEHLSMMDYMRQSIHLRGYAQKDPKQEYKREAFNLFSSMLNSIRREVIRILAVMQVEADINVEAVEEKMRHERTPQQLEFRHAEAGSALAAEPAKDEAVKETHIPYVRNTPKVGRNEPCPCGSGRKYKQCHGKIV